MYPTSTGTLPALGNATACSAAGIAIPALSSALLIWIAAPRSELSVVVDTDMTMPSLQPATG